MSSLKKYEFYSRDGITIYHADCRDILPHLEPGSVDLVLTDPPYSSGARRDAQKQVRGSMLREFEDEEWFSLDQMTGWGYGWFIRQILTIIRPKLVGGTHLYMFSDWRQTPNIYAMFESTGYRVNHCLVWDKGHYGMGSYWRNQHENIIFASLDQPNEMLDRGMGTVLQCKAVNSGKRRHPTEKPVSLLKRIIGVVPGNFILDPFMGSGSTLRAALSLGRRAIGIEIEEKYCQIAVKRLQQTVLPIWNHKSKSKIGPQAKQLSLEIEALDETNS